VLLIVGIIILKNQKLENFVEILSVREKIGQLLMIAPNGTNFDNDLKRLIEEYHIGNIKIFGKNYENKKQLLTLNVELQNCSLYNNHSIPMFIATDQEGGWIAHLKNGFTIPPSNMAIGYNGNTKYAFIAGKIIASELYAVGINVNFAPVVDLYLDKKNWVIGPRAYSSDKEVVVAMANEFINAHHSYNVLPVIKHYPGQGRMQVDSHIKPITNYASYETLLNNELYPFHILSKCELNGIMIGHISVPAIVRYIERKEKKNYREDYYLPATVSDPIIKKYLVKYNKTKSIIFSDEISMKGMSQYYNLNESVYKAIKSGINIVVIDSSYDKIENLMKYLESKYNTDNEFKQMVEKSLRKVLETKLLIFSHINRIKLFSLKIFHLKRFKFDEKQLDIINSERHKRMAYSISIESTHILKNRRHLIPLVEMNNFKNLSFTIIDSKKYTEQYVKQYTYRTKFIDIKNFKLQNISSDRRCIIIIFIRNKKDASLIYRIYKKNNNLIVINLLHPYNITDIKKVDTIICTYSDNSLQVKAGIDVLFSGKKDYKDILSESLTF